MLIDLEFPVQGETLATEHRYLLYSSLSHEIDGFHGRGSLLRFAPITGGKSAKGLIQLTAWSRLRVRLPSEQIGIVLPLAGRTLKVGDHTVHLGVPTVAPLRPATWLMAKIVTYKHATDFVRFCDVTRRRLEAMDIGGEPGIPLIQTGAREGQPRRQILHIKGRKVIGYALQVDGLTAEESIRLQELGLGGRTRMGCGFFIPYQPRLP